MDYKEKVIALLNSQELSKEQKEKLEKIFPELKESEDERIRKELIAMVKLSCTNGDDADKKIAWIERQVEQKPAWSEEDEMFVHGLIRGLAAKRDIHRHTTFSSDCIDITETINWLESLKNRVQPQEKQEWSKEDIDMIDWLIRCCEKEHEELCNDKYGHQDIVSDLKRDCRKKWDWIESLKNKVVPQNRWKPSEEQMEALYEETQKSDRIRDVRIVSLYEDLKKLRKE